MQPDPKYQLHATHGYTVYRGAVKVTKKVWKELRHIADEEAVLIFNGGIPDGDKDVGDDGDGKRSQAELDKDLSNRPECVRVLRAGMREFLVTRFPEHKPRDFVVLRSDEGCEDQPAHMDYTPEDTKNVQTNEEMPLAAVLCLEEGTVFDVWPWAFGRGFWGSPLTRYEHVREQLRPGDLLVFRGDLVHAGSGYEKANIRMHCYMDHRSTKRTANRTHYMDQDPRILPREGREAKRIKLSSK